MRTAAYARYSTDAQREASLEDQLRNCRSYCERQDWPAPNVYTDAAISGARSDRPGYRALLAEAQQYDVILVDDLSRLSRDSGETSDAVKRLRFAGVRLIGVSDGVDTARKSHKADVGLRGLMSELYLDDLADKTHRGLSGRALSGASAGGLPYGYRVVGTGQREIDAAQAAIVRRIYADYVAGMSPREIASALNAEHVPSARHSTWAASAIRPDHKRGLGILGNPIYIGRQIWNRSRWIKHPDSGRRVRKERPASEWITTEHPELVIIDADTWQAAYARLHGLRRPGRQHGGRPMRHLLSGLLRCAECGGPLVVVDARCYGCPTHKDRGSAVCGNALRIRRDAVEASLLAGIQSELLSDAAFERFHREYLAEIRRTEPDIEVLKRRLADAERVRGNILAALRAGIITPSVRGELIDAEAAIDAARREIDRAAAGQPARMLPRAREVWRSIIAAIADRARSIPAAREAIRALIGDAVVVRNENGATWCEIAPSQSQSQIAVVAGAGSARYLRAPLRIPITPPPGRGC